MEHISNEDKARSLCCSGCNDYNCYTKAGSCVQLKNIMRMAEWKDEQFEEQKQQFVEKTLRLFCQNCHLKKRCEKEKHECAGKIKFKNKIMEG
jgi:hypothetical protein